MVFSGVVNCTRWFACNGYPGGGHTPLYGQYGDLPLDRALSENRIQTHYTTHKRAIITPFAVHYEKIRNHLRETATNIAKIHSLARKYEHLGINQIQLRFLHFNQHSITLLGIYMRHWAYKREKYTFINANIKVINTILKVNRDN